MLVKTGAEVLTSKDKMIEMQCLGPLLVWQGLRFWLFQGGVQRSIQVLFNGLATGMVLTLIALT